VWASLFVAIMTIGMASTLLTWPHGSSTHTAWFWLRLLFFPAMAWCLLLGFRLLYVEQETERIQADLEQWAADHAKALQFAQDPLAVLDASYLCCLGCRAVTQQLALGNQPIEARQPGENSKAVRHTRLALEGTSMEARYEACFAELLDHLDKTLRALPAQSPLEVYLQYPAPAPSGWRDNGPAAGTGPNDGCVDILTVWQRCWAGFGYRATTTCLAWDENLMALDRWLDEQGGPALEKFVLVVAVQLHAVAPPDSAEAAVAFLFGWAPLAQRNAMSIKALLHRPVAHRSEQAPCPFATALAWGRAQATQITDMWYALSNGASKAALIQTATNLGIAASDADDGLAGAHDIDHALGHAGLAAPWLALALAVENVGRTNAPQLVASSQSTLCMAVVQPAMPPQATGSQG
jgi:hypothetical protein